jgi:hypothetical protein
MRAECIASVENRSNRAPWTRAKRNRLARAIVDQFDSGRIAALLDDFNTVAWPH